MCEDVPQRKKRKCNHTGVYRSSNGQLNGNCIMNCKIPRVVWHAVHEVVPRMCIWGSRWVCACAAMHRQAGVVGRGGAGEGRVHGREVVSGHGSGRVGVAAKGQR